ncbi:hypothetical protein [Streptacidiphilus sp. P02-A3a]|uniref:hypothetical protein n=1 Tax=Streptacidiphilus sp. P02-A3a TaxID=2704468 RepID=UPI0015FD8B85|nr:hypothetical protein [Streptacidiphilus sp. P02-A3a]QMU73362.1 hypothetical protein GXP74_39210 [Streptacidiphilus sp. P02-A3a]
MAVPRRSAPALTILAVLTVLGTGAALDAGTGAALAAEPAGRGGHQPDPYAGAGLPLRLPDGRRIRLVRPERPDRPQRPVAPPAPSDPGPGPDPGAPPAPSRPAPDPGGAEPPAASGGPLTDFPVPVLQPLFPRGPAAGGRGTPADPVGRPSGPGPDDGPADSLPADPLPDPSAVGTGTAVGPGTDADAGTDADDGSVAAPPDPAETEPAPAGDVSLAATVARASVTAANDAAAAAQAVSAAVTSQDQQRPWPAEGAGPPPLDPRALASPQAANLALPPAGPNGYGGTLRHRLLPLGVGLALIGAGAALLGWRLRRL